MRKPCIQRQPRSRTKTAQSGYMLITLMLFVTLLVIAGLALYPTLAFQVQRDREEEMVHRGVQYSRAVKHYYKKFGTYPPSLDALMNTQNIRFLRKKYKDPITGQDFKILRMTDVKMTFGPGITGAQTINGPLNNSLNSPLNNSLNNSLTGNQSLGSPLGGSSLGGGPSLTSNALSGPNAAANSNAQNADQSQNQANSAGTPGNASGTGSGQSGAGDNTQSQSGDQSQQSSGLGGIASSQLGGTTFGGTPIVGVASVSKKETIRVFNKKNHYNEWQFIYDPTSDTGGLLNAPVQPGLQQGVVAPVQGGGLNNPGGMNSNSPFPNNPGLNSPNPGLGSSSPNSPSPQN